MRTPRQQVEQHATHEFLPQMAGYRYLRNTDGTPVRRFPRAGEFYLCETTRDEVLPYTHDPAGRWYNGNRFIMEHGEGPPVRNPDYLCGYREAATEFLP